MKILIVANNKKGDFAPFIVDQVDSLRTLGVEVKYFGVLGKGILGYLNCLPVLKRMIKEYNPNIIHAHYGLSGLLANLQREVPVITTFHGSDIHSLGLNLILSKLCMRFSIFNIFVAENIFKMSKYKRKNYMIQSCGVDLETIKPVDYYKAREYFDWKKEDVYVLFAGSFSNAVKNANLARDAMKLLPNVTLIELKGYTRQEVSLLMNACDLQLTTSFRETGPLVVKEAMACNRPIVTTDVGDVRWVIGETEGCYVCSYEVEDCAEKIEMALEFSRKYRETKGRKRIMELGLECGVVAKRIKTIYEEIMVNN